MRRVLVVSPHFPPDSAAGAHRVRVLAPYLERHGWIPTVLTVDPSGYEGALDDELARMAHGDVEVIRAPAIRAEWTRPLGIGDLGLRSAAVLRRAARKELREREYDALYLTTYPVYPALMGPGIRRAFDIPFVLDLQDPWVGAWGSSVGGGPDGIPDFKSRASRRALATIERRVVPHADAITSVSSELLRLLASTYPALAGKPQLELPIGIDPCDMAWVQRHPGEVHVFNRHDGLLHFVYVGTLLPLAQPVLRVLFAALRALRERDAALATRFRLHFVGTSNQADSTAGPRVMAVAHDHGIADLVTEHPTRVPFVDALRIQMSASALVVLGSTESRYTASKIAPALASGRPVLMLAHNKSDAVRQARSVRDPAIVCITFDDATPIDAITPSVTATLADWLHAPPTRTTGLWSVANLTGPVLAGRLAAVLDTVARS